MRSAGLANLRATSSAAVRTIAPNSEAMQKLVADHVLPGLAVAGLD